MVDTIHSPQETLHNCTARTSRCGLSEQVLDTMYISLENVQMPKKYLEPSATPATLKNNVTFEPQDCHTRSHPSTRQPSPSPIATRANESQRHAPLPQPYNVIDPLPTRQYVGAVEHRSHPQPTDPLQLPTLPTLRVIFRTTHILS
jgi:hypothetical protein